MGEIFSTPSGDYVDQSQQSYTRIPKIGNKYLKIIQGWSGRHLVNNRNRTYPSGNRSHLFATRSTWIILVVEKSVCTPWSNVIEATPVGWRFSRCKPTYVFHYYQAYVMRRQTQIVIKRTVRPGRNIFWMGLILIHKLDKFRKIVFTGCACRNIFCTEKHILLFSIHSLFDTLGDKNVLWDQSVVGVRTNLSFASYFRV